MFNCICIWMRICVCVESDGVHWTVCNLFPTPNVEMVSWFHISLGSWFRVIAGAPMWDHVERRDKSPRWMEDIFIYRSFGAVLNVTCLTLTSVTHWQCVHRDVGLQQRWSFQWRYDINPIPDIGLNGSHLLQSYISMNKVPLLKAIQLLG